MKPFSLIILCFLSFNLLAQTSNERLNAQLEVIKEAHLSQDFKTVTDYTYPKVYEMMGGKEKMIESASYTATKLASQGYVLEQLSYQNPSEFFIYNGDMQCVLKQIKIISTPQGKIKTQTPTIAISNDGGENWVFLDIAGMPRASIEKFYENLHPDIVINQAEKQKLN